MSHPTAANYKADTLFPRVERAIAQLLRDRRPVSAPEVFVRMGMLAPDKVAEWRLGRVPYLEGVIQGSLSKINRVLRIISLHAHDLRLLPAPSHTAGNVKFKGALFGFPRLGIQVLSNAPDGFRSPPSEAGPAPRHRSS
jgi:hypothetical protein